MVQCTSNSARSAVAKSRMVVYSVSAGVWRGRTMEHPEIEGVRDWRPLARGGLAVVWQAWYTRLWCPVAVKVYEPRLDEGYGRCFVQEAAAAGRLAGHRGIVTVHDVGMLPDGRPYLIMELCPGGSLTQWLRPECRPSEERVRQVGVRIADALAAVHASGVVHGDIKPANVLLDSVGHPRLADFGLAAVAGEPDPPAHVLRTTPAYAPPEVFWRPQVTEAGDVFSLAATLYALLAGGPPRGMRPNPVTLEQMLAFAFIPIGRIPGVKWDVMGTLMAGLSNDPAARPTAAAFREELAKVPVLRAPTLKPRVDVAVVTHSGSPHAPSWAPVRSADSARGSAAAATVAAGPQRSAREAPSVVEGRQQERRRNGVLALAAAAVVTVVASTTAWLVSAPGTQSANVGGLASTTGPSRPSEPRQPTAGSTTSGVDRPESGPADQKTIQLVSSAKSAKSWQTVAIEGTYVGRAEVLLRVQQWEAGKWRAFPMPAKTDKSGRFTAYVELGRPSRYRLRVLDPNAGVKSKPIELVIRG